MLDQELLVCFVDEAGEAMEAWQEILLKLQKANTPDNLNALFRIAHNLKGTSKAVGLEEFGDAIHRVEDVISALKNSQITWDLNAQTFLSKSYDIFQQWLDSFVGKAPCPSVDELMQLREKILNQATKAATPEQESKTLKLQEPKENAKNSAPQHSPLQSIESMRVPVLKIDTLIQMLGELTTQQAILSHAKKYKQYQSEIFEECIDALGRLVREVHEQAISLRMQNLTPTFARLEKIILDVARDLGKAIQVQVIGSETELEKSILEKILDPLVHIVRNAVDHGIESGEKRSHKNPVASIQLSARQEGREVVIEVQDDGHGINPKKVFDSAVSKGLISASEKLDEKQIFMLLFLPGFSTAEKVTQISGRGVGLDVVRQTLEEINGQIEVQSTLGKGSRFIIRIPLSLSIIDALVVSVKGSPLCVPIYQVTEILDLNECSVREEKGQAPLYEVRGQWIPAFQAAELFGLPNHGTIKSKVGLRISTQNASAIITVDQIIDRSTLLLRPSQDKWKRLEKILGLSILGDGNPVPMMDLFKCLSSEENRAQNTERQFVA